MNASDLYMKRPLGRAAVLLLAWAFTFVPTQAALGASIENTAHVAYTGAHGQQIQVSSNTVVAEVMAPPTQASLEFRRYDPTGNTGPAIPTDGGQCLVGGAYQPLPPVDVDSDLEPGETGTEGATGYYIGEPAVIVVADANRNVDPGVRDFVEVEVTTTTGDAETLRLQETGPDTGVFAGAIQSVPMPPPVVQNDCVLSLIPYAEITATYRDTDYPLDVIAVAAIGYAPLPQDRTVIVLEQQVSKQIVEIGDFLQYTLVLRNIHDAPAMRARIRDVLPVGLRYRSGSLRVGSAASSPVVTPADATAAPGAGAVAGPVILVPAPDPEMGADGRSLVFPVGDLAPGASVTAMFIAEVGPGTRGPDVLNYAIATAAGALSSNETDSLVRMRESMTTSAFTIIGRVIEAASCDAPSAGHKGVPRVRVMLDDGTFVATDEDGYYHFEGVRPGTHVAQIDLATLPQQLQPAACLDNTRFAGRSHSRFVEAQGGMLVRADFFVAPREGQRSAFGARLRFEASATQLKYAVDLDAGPVPVSKLRAMLVLPDGSHPVPGSVRLDGEPLPDPTRTGNVAIFDLGDPGASWRRQLTFDVQPPAACPDGGYTSKLVALFDAGGESGQRTPPAEATTGCPPDQATAGDSGRVETTFQAAVQAQAASPYAEQEKIRNAILDTTAAAGGGDVDWFAGREPAPSIVFPAEGYNPRSPATRAVIKYAKGQRARLRINGEEPTALKVEGTRKSADGAAAVTIWRALPLREGDNLIEADVLDDSGAVVASLSRNVYYAGAPVRAELVPEQSILVADGLRRPVVAVRMLDRSGRPVRAGMVGDYALSQPYLPAQTVDQMQSRQIAAGDAAGPRWHTEGDDGIAYIELEPTTMAGLAKFSFTFSGDQDGSGLTATERHQVTQELEAWLKAVAREWVVVGFAKGSVGYETLADNMKPLPEGEDGGGVRAEGQVSLYAKGRVLGEWLLTMAYDSGKPTDQLRRRGLHSTIDPGQYYMLYGDRTQQGYDASSAEKLYLKLERDQFYALFGDFQTGLDRGELTRYQRAMTGAKVEYRGQLVEFNGFAARTSQSFARDEIQGDGTSGLYRLSHAGIVLNSERVRIETRERYHSEQIVGTRELTRHLDYDIDYDNGTLFFREPIASRDFDLNPNFIVVEYETRGSAEEYTNAGGRLGIRLLGDRLQAGMTMVRDEDMQARSDLAGVDARFMLTPNDELRAEFAATRSDDRNDNESRGNAWLLQWQHRGEQYDLLAYARRSGAGFGLGQQNASEAGMFKAGLQGQWRVGPGFVLQGEAYRLENLAGAATRDAVTAELAYRQEDWSAKAGVKWARDRSGENKEAQSQQVTLGASRYFFDRRLELNMQADIDVGGKNESVDFPNRLQVGAAYQVNEAFRVLAAQEFTDGEDRDTSTTRVGFEARPWKDATLTSTLNQSRISEYGPRSFALFGLNQKFIVNEKWSFDVAVDSSQAFDESGDVPLVVDPSQPIQAGGIRDGGALTEDFVALSGGTTYRTETWMWNLRTEARQSDNNDRYGFTTAFLRQIKDGVAMSASASAFSQRNEDGSTGILANAQLSWAWRPLGSQWSMLDKLEFRLDELRAGNGESIIGQGTLAARGDARSARFINNFVLNYASGAWDGEDAAGNPLDLYQRSQLSLYYGSKYVIDTYGSDDYSGYTDILGAEYRFDLTSRIDIGIRASILHSWSQDTIAWAFGPSVGFTPFTNAWVSVGYNVRGFNDRDFESSHYTAQGAYLVFRMKFDQETFGLDRARSPGH